MRALLALPRRRRARCAASAALCALRVEPVWRGRIPPARVMARWLALSCGIVLLDQLTKFVILQNFTVNKVVEVTSFFNLVLVHNRGAAFSFLSDAAGWQ